MQERVYHAQLESHTGEPFAGARQPESTDIRNLEQVACRRGCRKEQAGGEHITAHPAENRQTTERYE